ncbi:SRPBCC family protein [Streptomyces sp. HMX112]|uniref:SRPBCC family protein n=1 Tax=Streptomyces sp. HMX112 TaxID=3390850 RepID=UPI003A7FFE0D
MAHRLRPVRPDFVGTAPVRLVFATRLAAPPPAVYRALTERVAETPVWCRAVASARPIAGGAGREIRLRGGVVFQGRILVTDVDERHLYRVEETNAPGVRALLEEWRLGPDGSGTRVRWTLAADGTAPFRLTMRLARGRVGRAFRDAMRGLDGWAASSPAP